MRIFKEKNTGRVFCLYQVVGNYTYIVVCNTYIGLRDNTVETCQPLSKFEGFPNYHYSQGYISIKNYNALKDKEF